ncbi:DUF2975 domain-containing protein [Planctomonas psychrotolerans]|uniref:DUF2975 domain-containing protein n=1 Tax=Planctomonas psychrotolerans TaxID=2528712 RepID=UPI00123970DF|nr:DUF2975 domain-containing protein [Planctomonas psychrotolerans]
MSSPVILALRALVIVLGLGAVIAQAAVLFPVFVQTVAQEEDFTTVPVAIAVLVVVLAACAEAALFAIWQLLSMVRRDAIFTPRAFRWVDLIIGAGLVVTVILLALSVYVFVVILPIEDAPGLLAITGGAALCAAAFVLLMVVMRGLLRSATSLRSELAEVV